MRYGFKISLFFLFVILNSYLVFSYDEVDINIDIQPRGPTSFEYNIVGDIFSYYITLTNDYNSEINKDFQVCIKTIYISKCKSFLGVKIEPGQLKVLTPNQTEDLIDIFPFESIGTYSIEISSQDIIFYKKYDVENKRYFIKYYNFYSEYFDSMPKWQYELFQKEYDAASKTKEANEKLLELNINLDRATNSMLWVSWLMFFVAVISLFTSLWGAHLVKSFFKVLIISIGVSIVLLILFLTILFLFN